MPGDLPALSDDSCTRCVGIPTDVLMTIRHALDAASRRPASENATEHMLATLKSKSPNVATWADLAGVPFPSLSEKAGVRATISKLRPIVLANGWDIQIAHNNGYRMIQLTIRIER